MPETTDPLAYTLPHAVQASGLARTRIYDLIERGDLAAFKAGRRTLIRADSLRSYLASLPPARIGAGRRTSAAA
jgi:Helix-turn-helix domain